MEFKIKSWGGKRTGAGRPNKSGAVNHMRRQKFTKDKPAHVTFRLLKGLSGLRTKSVHELLKVTVGHLPKFGVRAIHYSLQGNHIHLILEADSPAALSRAMKSFGCRFAKGAKHLRGFKSAKVFNGRYHLTVIDSPRQARNAIRYVLLNQSHHVDLIEHIDEFSSGFYFKGWRQLLGPKFKDLVEQQAITSGTFDLPKHLSVPDTWLLAEGWKRAKA